jgi:ABC-type nitrate/sulfonate/bicarbonate transport system permease component
MTQRNLRLERIGYIASPLIVIMIWKIVTYLRIFNPVILPSPESIGQAFLSELISGELLKHIQISLFRVFLGFGIGSAMAVSLGLLIGWSEKAKSFVDPIVEIVRPIPPMAWIPLSILWFGIGELPKIFIIILGVFFPVLTNTVVGVKSIEKGLLKLARSMGLKGFTLFKEVIVVGASPFIITGLRIGLGFGWMCLVTAELIAAQAGLGYMIEEAKMLLLTNKVILGMLTIGFLGILIDRLIMRLEKIVLPWW